MRSIRNTVTKARSFLMRKEAEALGINDGGELLVRKSDGSETAIYAGEVSVRGIYGYV